MARGILARSDLGFKMQQTESVPHIKRLRLPAKHDAQLALLVHDRTRWVTSLVQEHPIHPG